MPLSTLGRPFGLSVVASAYQESAPDTGAKRMGNEIFRNENVPSQSPKYFKKVLLASIQHSINAFYLFSDRAEFKII